MARQVQIDELYQRLDAVAERTGRRRLSECSGRDPWPQSGVYFFFEPGEVRSGEDRSRVVRVGTHALTATSNTKLWTRLRAHRGSTGGRNPGGGNHRGSIFRLHVGTALINRDECWEQEAATWGHGSSASRDVRDSEVELERAVSAHIGAMEVVVVAVDDREARGQLERDAIALLSNHSRDQIDPASPDWLGRHADRDDVRQSGLWNVNHVRDAIPTEAALGLIV